MGANSQTTAATPAMALTTSRSALRILLVREGWAEPARKSYLQSQRSALSGLANPQMGHSFIEKAAWDKQFPSLRRSLHLKYSADAGKCRSRRSASLYPTWTCLLAFTLSWLAASRRLAHENVTTWATCGRDRCLPGVDRKKPSANRLISSKLKYAYGISLSFQSGYYRTMSGRLPLLPPFLHRGFCFCLRCCVLDCGR